MPANGMKFSATATAALFPESVSHAPVPPGRGGTEILSSTSAVAMSTEKMIPATAAARGVRSGLPLRSGPWFSTSSVMASSRRGPITAGPHGSVPSAPAGRRSSQRVIFAGFPRLAAHDRERPTDCAESD